MLSWLHAEPSHSSLHWCPSGAACARQGASARLHEAGEPCPPHPAQPSRAGLPAEPWGLSPAGVRLRAREPHRPTRGRGNGANTHLALDYLPYASHTNVSAGSSARGEERTFPLRPVTSRTQHAPLPPPPTASPTRLVPARRRQGANLPRG